MTSNGPPILELDNHRPDRIRSLEATITYEMLHETKQKHKRCKVKRSSVSIVAKFKKIRKTVRFDTTCCTFGKLCDLKREHKNGINWEQESCNTSTWYSPSDLIGFRESTINVARIFEEKNNGNPYHLPNLPRGMEAMSITRRNHKEAINKCVLMVYRFGKSQDYIAQLYTQLSKWNKDVALRDAKLDCYEVYQTIPDQSPPLTHSKATKTNVLKLYHLPGKSNAKLVFPRGNSW